MSLNTRRKWLNPSECSRLLSERLSESVSESDVARLIADGDLRPSVNIPSRAFAKRVTIESVPLADTLADIDTAISENRRLLKKEPVIGSTLIQYARPVNDEIFNFSGVWEVLSTGTVKREAERKYSECEGLPCPERSIYDIKGAIITDKGEKYQIQTMIDPRKEMAELIEEARRNGGQNSGFITGHIDKLQKAANSADNGYYPGCLVPCISLPEGAYLVVQAVHLNEFIEAVKASTKKSPSVKTANAQAEFIFALLASKYGENVARNPRPHIDGKMGVISRDLTQNGFKPPAGNTVAAWMKGVNS